MKNKNLLIGVIVLVIDEGVSCEVNGKRQTTRLDAFSGKVE